MAKVVFVGGRDERCGREDDLHLLEVEDPRDDERDREDREDDG